ncbi:hypothetical protein BKK80_00905 [Cupriavidus malaysiensis]|uniref:Phage major capsid protein n=1 Tax=Cupriavidus malaysiensis TaxID=367825 RepID=A0ABN4TBQ9_9BURK|nr:hypothetical protein BKK80_00905 [Cupriavidus malaysiensis]
MRNDTRRLFDAYTAKLAELNGVTSVSTKFNVQPSVQQRLETRMQESSDFLSRINIIGVDEQEGEKVGLGVSGPIASTTDTTTKDRETSDVIDLTGRAYRGMAHYSMGSIHRGC